MSIDLFVKDEINNRLNGAVHDAIGVALVKICKEIGEMKRFTADDLLDESQVAEYLGVKMSTLRSWRVKKQGIPYIVVGDRLVRYKFDDILSFVNKHQVRVHGNF